MVPFTVLLAAFHRVYDHYMDYGDPLKTWFSGVGTAEDHLVVFTRRRPTEAEETECRQLAGKGVQVQFCHLGDATEKESL